MTTEKTKSPKSFMAKLRKLDGAVSNEYDPLQHCARTPMPSVNWAMGVPGGGLPFGYSMLLYGPPKGGKSILCNAIVGQLHKDDEEAIAISFNTELRGAIQANSNQHKTWGIDPDRYAVYDVNEPDKVFDRIETDIAAMCEEGAKIKLVIIDSLSGIQGRRALNATSVNTQQIGDHALTMSTGLKRILPVIRKYGIALICTDHVRAELDLAEQMRGNTLKMASAWATKHTCEFFCLVQPNKSKEGKVSLAGEDFVDESVVDFMKKGQKSGHKIRFTVVESSLGKSGRTAQFTLDYDRGIINQYEEIYTLAVNYGVIKRPNNTMYEYDGQSYRGIVAMLTALRDNTQMQKDIMDKVWKLSFNGGEIEPPVEKQ